MTTYIKETRIKKTVLKNIRNKIVMTKISMCLKHCKREKRETFILTGTFLIYLQFFTNCLSNFIYSM